MAQDVDSSKTVGPSCSELSSGSSRDAVDVEADGAGEPNADQKSILEP